MKWMWLIWKGIYSAYERLKLGGEIGNGRWESWCINSISDLRFYLELFLQIGKASLQSRGK